MSYTNEWHDGMSIGRALFEKLRGDAQKAREGKGYVPPRKQRVGQQKQKKAK